MRHLLLVALLLAGPGSLGCFALDLIDEGQEEMERYSGGSSQETAEAASPAASPEKAPTREELRRWWNRARSLAPSEASSSMIRCQLASGVLFTRESDCLTRGGRVLGG